ICIPFARVNLITIRIDNARNDLANGIRDFENSFWCELLGCKMSNKFPHLGVAESRDLLGTQARFDVRTNNRTESADRCGFSWSPFSGFELVQPSVGSRLDRYAHIGLLLRLLEKPEVN